MTLVTFILFAWLCIQVFISLPHKLPLSANVLLFLAVELVLVNKLTIMGYNFSLFTINTGIETYLSLIVHNDFTITFLLLIFANVILTSTNVTVRLWIAFGVFTAQMGLGYLLRKFDVLIYVSWSYAFEASMILLVMVYTWAVGRLVQHMADKEGWVR